MVVTHNYFWPTINGRVYYDKPLGSYWLVIFSTPFTGGLNEAATRLPSAIAGLLAVLLLMILVRRFYDARTAILAGVILATSFSFVFFSRDASADVETITGELAALLLFNYNEEVRGAEGGIWVVDLMADHGRDVAHQGPARIRAAAIGDRRVFMPARRMGAALPGDSPRLGG